MSDRIDLFLTSLVRFNASAVVLASDSNISLRFPTGERFANQSTSHAELVALVEQIAPAGAAGEVRAGLRAAFSYHSGGKSYAITVEPRPGKWRVKIEADPSAPPPVREERTRDPREERTREKVREEAPPSARARAAAAPAAAATQPASILSHATEEHGRQLRPIERMLARMQESGASDLHLSSGNVPKIRLHGEIQDLAPDQSVLDAEAVMALLSPIVPAANRAEFEERNDTDFAHAIPGVSRFRANLYRDRHGPGAVFRAIPFQILSPEQIGLPKGVLELCFLSKGLVVVTGPTGSGKSTTLATLIDYINRNRKDHIITIEDPIEFVHDNKGCLVNQREVHTHTRSFKDALRAALREDPDIVLVGEMRDLETIAIAVETAETGHLVFGTLHTTTAPSTVDRIIDQFPADRQEQIRQMLSESLRGVIAQTLCKKVGGGRMAAYEILLGSSAVSNLIRERKTFQLFSLMQTGRAQGMVTLNDSLLDLVKRKLVEPREAFVKAVNKGEFKNLLSREGITLELGATP
ncbi:MAG TPA: type IV pilus twitching motility protein PilT [Kofleriaceae bacterium]|nr:type IV pilus twitching motility protein PilT [Kofleriaceae bacterium]